MNRTGQPHIPETTLARIWEEQWFSAERLETTDRRSIRILRRGRHNHDSGPDFTNALIRIDQQSYQGDIELHIDIADWHAHGHDTDPKYNRTILHVVLGQPSHPRSHDVSIRTANGLDVPTVVLQPFLTVPFQELLDQIQQSDTDKQQLSAACQHALGAHPLEHILTHLRQLGKARLYQRARRFEKWLPRRSFQQVLYEAICEGLGYASNTRPFLELARRLPLDRILAHLPQHAENAPQTPLPWIQAMLFGAAGLLPGVQDLSCSDPETQAYVAELRSLWEMLAPCLDVVPMPKEAWRFFRLRPPNFPTRRIAALSYLVLGYALQPLFDNYLRLFTLFSDYPEAEQQYIHLLERTFYVPAVGYWKGRYQFGKPVFSEHDRVFLGQSRIRDILISGVFPVLLLYALHDGQPRLEAQILKLYAIFPSPTRNHVIRRVAAQLFNQRPVPRATLQTAILYQGMLQLYKQYCTLPACRTCPLHTAT